MLLNASAIRLIGALSVENINTSQSDTIRREMERSVTNTIRRDVAGLEMRPVHRFCTNPLLAVAMYALLPLPGGARR
jgi:hypothetical protein